MATLFTEPWAYSTGDLLTVAAGIWDGPFAFANPGELWVSAGTVKWDLAHGAPDASFEATAEYTTYYDLSSGSFTISIPVALLRPPTQTPGNSGGGIMSLYLLDGNNSDQMLVELDISLSTTGVGNPSTLTVDLYDAGFIDNAEVILTTDWVGTIDFTMVPGSLSVYFNNVLVVSLATSQTLSTQTAPAFSFVLTDQPGVSPHTQVEITGPMVFKNTGGAPGPVPSAPGTITASNVQETTATVKWGASTGGTGLLTYTVEINGGVSWTSPGTTTATEFFLTGLLPGTVYSVRVHAIDSLNVSGPLTTATSLFTTLPMGLFVQGMLPVHNVIPAGDPTPYFTENWPNLNHWAGNTSGSTIANAFVVGPGKATNDIAFKTPIPGPPFSLAFNLITTLGANTSISSLDFELNEGTSLAGLDLNFFSFGTANGSLGVVLNDNSGIIAFSGTYGVNLHTGSNSSWLLSVAPDGIHVSISGTANTGSFIQFGNTTRTVAALDVPMHAITWPATLDIVSVVQSNTGFKIT